MGPSSPEPGHLFLRLANTEFEVRVTEPGWLRMMSSLWEPFAIREPSESHSWVSFDRSSDGWIVASPSDRRAVPDLWEALIHGRYLLVEEALTKMIDRLDLHAAVVEKDDRACLFVGTNGVGKTTMALEMLDRGWSYFSDDVAPIRLEDGLVESFPKPLGIRDPDLWFRFAADVALPEGTPPPSGSFLAPATSFELLHPHLAVPRYLVFPRFDGESVTQLDKVSPGAATAKCLAHLRPVDPPAVALIATICERAASFELTYASSPEGADLLISALTSKGPSL